MEASAKCATKPCITSCYQPEFYPNHYLNMNFVSLKHFYNKIEQDRDNFQTDVGLVFIGDKASLNIYTISIHLNSAFFCFQKSRDISYRLNVICGLTATIICTVISILSPMQQIQNKLLMNGILGSLPFQYNIDIFSIAP